MIYLNETGGDKLEYSNIYKKYGLNVSAYPKEALSNFDIGMEIVRNCGYDIKYLSPELQNNAEIIRQALNFGDALQFLSDKWRDNEEMVMLAIKNDRNALQYASDRLKDKDDVVMYAVSKDGNNLAYASDRLKDNEVIVDAAIRLNPYSVSFASDRIKHIEKYALQIFCNQALNDYNSRYGLSRDIDNEMLGNSTLMKKVIKETGNYRFISFVNTSVPGYKHVLKELSRKESILRYINDPQILKDKEIVIASLVHNGGDLQYASKELRDDKEVVLKAVWNSGCALQMASKRLRNDIEVVNVAILSDPRAIAYASEDILHLAKGEEQENDSNANQMLDV